MSFPWHHRLGAQCCFFHDRCCTKKNPKLWESRGLCHYFWFIESILALCWKHPCFPEASELQWLSSSLISWPEFSINSATIYLFSSFYPLKCLVWLCFFFRSWLYLGLVLLAIPVCIGGYLIVFLSWIKKNSDWENAVPMAIPLATGTFIAGSIW